MFKPVFTLNLNQKVLPGRVAIGEYDGRNACLTAATTAEKVFIHNPRQSMTGGGASSGRMVASGSSHEIVNLNINQRVTALAAGQMDPGAARDCLLVGGRKKKGSKLAICNCGSFILLFVNYDFEVGTPTNLLAYDVEENADLFHKDVPDGVNSIAVGVVGGREEPLAVVGGNCSLQGFNRAGDDPFWKVPLRQTRLFRRPIRDRACLLQDGDGRQRDGAGHDGLQRRREERAHRRIGGL